MADYTAYISNGVNASGAATMEATPAIISDVSSMTDNAEPVLIVLIFSCIGLFVSLLAARYGLEVDPALF
jgi:hypothetical protein